MWATVVPVTNAPAQSCRETRHVDQPTKRDLLEHSGGRRDVVEACVLIPRRREPVRRQRRRKRAADHETEEARAGDAHRRGRSDTVELVEDTLRRDRLVLQLDIERRQAGHRLRRRPDAPLVDVFEISGRTRGGRRKQIVHLGALGAVSVPVAVRRRLTASRTPGDRELCLAKRATTACGERVEGETAAVWPTAPANAGRVLPPALWTADVAQPRHPRLRDFKLKLAHGR